MPTVLVTGAAGFIGSHLVRRLLERGDTVRGIDNFATGRESNLAGVEGDFELIRGDINDPAALERAVKGADIIFHEAAIPSVARSVDDPMASHHANVDGTVAILEAARKHDVGRVVYAASSSAYGDTPTLPKVETMPVSPRSPYAANKVTGEMYLSAYAHSFGMQTVGLRYFNVFGPRQDPGSFYSAVIPKFITLLLAGKAPTVHGDGMQSRDFTYIDNVVQANFKAAEAEGVAGEVFNCACGERFTLIDLIDKLKPLCGAEGLEPEFGPSRTGDVKHSLADIDKARRLLGYEPEVSFDEGLKRVVEWYKANPDA